jgi:ribosomal protein S6--L-glutamate ligase
VKIGVVLEKTNPVTAEMLDLLRGRGATLEVLVPRELSINVHTLALRSELYVLKSTATDMGFSVAAALDARGAYTMNPFSVIALLRNKVAAMTRMAQRGLPIPMTYAVATRESLEGLLDEGPLVVKPYQGSRGVGVEVVETREQLAKLTLAAPILAQRYHRSDDALDRKISVIGDRVFGVMRRFPIVNYDEKRGTPFEPDDEIRDIARRICRALGIDLVSFDIVVSQGRPYLVDVGSFGSFMGVPDAARMLCDWVVRAWEQRP